MQRETENQNNFEHVYTLLDLEEPSAQSIRDLENIMGMSYSCSINVLQELSSHPLPDGFRYPGCYLSAAHRNPLCSSDSTMRLKCQYASRGRPCAGQTA